MPIRALVISILLAGLAGLPLQAQLSATVTSISFPIQGASPYSTYSKSFFVHSANPSTALVQVSAATTTGGAWLTARISGTRSTPALVEVQAIPSGLTPGTYAGTVVVSDMEGKLAPLTIPITLVQTAPLFTVSPTAVNLTATYGGPKVSQT